jgi:hypothetical protein
MTIDNRGFDLDHPDHPGGARGSGDELSGHRPQRSRVTGPIHGTEMVAGPGSRHPLWNGALPAEASRSRLSAHLSTSRGGT